MHPLSRRFNSTARGFIKNSLNVVLKSSVINGKDKTNDLIKNSGRETVKYYRTNRMS